MIIQIIGTLFLIGVIWVAYGLLWLWFWDRHDRKKAK